jgi:nucleoside 2-deoxyribosyltransferase
MASVPSGTKPRCYVASPLGFTEAGRHYMCEVYLPALATVVEPVDPWALVSEAEIASALAQGAERTLAREIGRRNIEAIRTCTLMAVYLDGGEPDPGTVAELGYGAGLGLRCIALRSDQRSSGELGLPVNLHLEAFLTLSGGVLVGTLEALVAALGQAARESEA